MLRTLARQARTELVRRVDRRRADELAGVRVVFHHLRETGFLAGFEGGRILEIGPKHGEDSKLLADLRPAELVLVELPEKRGVVEEWLPTVAEMAPTRLVEANLLYLDREQWNALGTFDLVWCLGVLYHNAEHLRLLRKLFKLCHDRAAAVVESATTRDRRLRGMNAVEVHWPRTYQDTGTITQLPSRRALASFMEMAGFADVRLVPVYSRSLARDRAVVTGVRDERSRPQLGYGEYVAGDAA